MMKEARNNTLLIHTIILTIIHAVGVIGIHSSCRDLFLVMTPVNLIICAALLSWHHPDFNKSFIIFALITFLFGFFIEVAGVHTGKIFGEYTYGRTLGWKIMEVPLIIGLNWLILVYSAGAVTSRLKTGIVLKSIAGAALLVMLDLVLEQAATMYDFWSWNSGIIPLQNYAAWFGVSFLLLLLFHFLNFRKDNKLAAALYIIQFLFFVLLLIF
ncbi:MAG TPA: carotenoid biosynthesis protein [Bacteroidia bacterium]|jgi:putative membrane protein